ncbi:MAG: hypothetical protein MJA83_02680, partial [Gammaproteobacteria bacterium]|nr:hypothetical protein [Gammaproteobacteria bacterium]
MRPSTLLMTMKPRVTNPGDAENTIAGVWTSLQNPEDGRIRVEDFMRRVVIHRPVSEPTHSNFEAQLELLRPHHLSRAEWRGVASNTDEVVNASCYCEECLVLRAAPVRKAVRGGRRMRCGDVVVALTVPDDVDQVALWFHFSGDEQLIWEKTVPVGDKTIELSPMEQVPLHALSLGQFRIVPPCDLEIEYLELHIAARLKMQSMDLGMYELL